MLLLSHLKTFLGSIGGDTHILNHFHHREKQIKYFVSFLQESVELPLTHPEYYEEMGIKPPKGVILYGPPGTGKTLLAKAVANQTSATFLRVVGSELIQKYLVSFTPIITFITFLTIIAEKKMA